MEVSPQKPGSRSAAVRAEAVRAFVVQPGINLEPLYKALNDKSNLVMAAAAAKLAQCPVKDAVPFLVERYWWVAEDGLRRDPGCLARVAMMTALTKLRAVEAASVFFHAIETYQPERTGLGMDDTAIELRTQAAVAVTELRLPGALLALALLLFDDEPRVPHAPSDRLYVNMATRIAAARCLAVLGDTGAVAVLGVRLKTGSQETAEVLVECMDAIAALDAEAALRVVRPYLQHATPYLAAGAATALACLPADWHDQVISCLSTACGQVAKDAQEPLALAIASIRSDKTVPALAELAEHRETSVRLAAVAGLRQRGDHAAVAALQRIAERRADRTVASAARAAWQELWTGE